MWMCAAVEILILAHDCFSLTCNMEGIVRVLQAARHLSHTHLAHGDGYGLLVSSWRPGNLWIVHSPVCQKPGGSLVFLSLQVRLLTGIGRVQWNDVRLWPAPSEPSLRDACWGRRSSRWEIECQCISYKIQKWWNVQDKKLWKLVSTKGQ